jgi:hypothetical protein
MSRRNHKQKPNRTKRYVQKHVRLPVMGALRREFEVTLHSALTMAEIGLFNQYQFDRIGQSLNVIWGALELRPPKGSEAAKLVIEGAMRAMNDAGKRGDATGIWVLRNTEQAAVLAGIQKAEEVLPRLDVLTLNEAIQQFDLIRIEDIKRTVAIDPASGPDKTAVTTIKAGEIDSITLIETDDHNHIKAVHKIVRAPEERTPA